MTNLYASVWLSILLAVLSEKIVQAASKTEDTRDVMLRTFVQSDSINAASNVWTQLKRDIDFANTNDVAYWIEFQYIASLHPDREIREQSLLWVASELKDLHSVLSRDDRIKIVELCDAILYLDASHSAKTKLLFEKLKKTYSQESKQNGVGPGGEGPRSGLSKENEPATGPPAPKP